MRGRTSWGLDLGASAVKLVKVEDSGGRLHATTYGPVAIHPPSPQGDTQQELLKALERLFQMAGTRPSELHCSMPRHAATVKFPELPRASYDQLGRMVRLDAQRYIPFPLEEVVLGFLDLTPLLCPREPLEPQSADEGEPASMSQLLLVAVRNEIVKRYRSAVSTADRRPAALSISSLGAWELFRYASAKGEVSQEGARLLLDLGGYSTTVSVLLDGALVFSRSVGVGGDALTSAFANTYELDHTSAEAMKTSRGLGVLEMPLDRDVVDPPAAIEDWYGRLVMEVRRSVAAFSAEYRHREVRAIHILGGSANLPGLAERLEAELGVEVSMLPSAGLCRDPQFMEATGQALWGFNGSLGTLDLVPEEEERRKVQLRRRMRAQVAAVVALLALGAAGVWGIQEVQKRTAEARRVASAQKEANRFAAEAEGLRKQRDKLQQQLSDVESATRPRYSWLDVLQEVSSRTPKDIWLLNVTFEKGKPMLLRGSAKLNTSPPTMASALSQSGLFDNVNLGYSNEAKVGNQTVVNFIVTANIKGNLPKPKKSVRKRTRRAETP